MKTILITGAAGGVAGMIRPILRADYRLRLSDIRPVPDLVDGEESVPADLGDMAALRKAIAGVDGTMRRNRSRAAGSAHLKTGSLRDVVAIAGYVHANSGRRYVLVAMTNHANAYASRAAFDALLDWTIRDE